MRGFPSAASVVVGVDGSKAALQAAVWAIDEAVSRDIPLRLLYAIDPADLYNAEADHLEFALARSALYAAERAVDATGKPVKLETETLVGRPVAVLAAAARSAAMVCIGSVGKKCARGRRSSVASVLPALAESPVAVIHQSAGRAAGSIVVEADNGVVLRHAFEEAALRRAPLRVVAPWRAEAPEAIAEEKRLARARLSRRVDTWKRLYPDVQVEPVAVHGDVCRYLIDNIGAVQLFVVGAARSRCDANNLSHLGCSVLTVGRNHL